MKLLKLTTLFLLITYNILAQNKPVKNQNSYQSRQQDKGSPNTQLIIGNDTINKSDENGELQGKWERTHPDSSFKCKGVYKDGYKMGYWERKWPNGNWRYQKNMQDGYLDGYCKFFYENGNIEKEGNYKMSKEDGIILSYYENGNLESKVSFINGVLQGHSKYFDENGTLIREGAHSKNERNGIWKFYSPKTSKLNSQKKLVEYNNGQAVSTKISPN